MKTVETYRDNETDKIYFPTAMANIEIQSIFVIVKPKQKQKYEPLCIRCFENKNGKENPLEKNSLRWLQTIFMEENQA